MALDWIEQWSTTGRDLEWHPVTIVVGLLNTETGVRFAVVVGDSLGILVPDLDHELSTNVARFVDVRGSR